LRVPDKIHFLNASSHAETRPVDLDWPRRVGQFQHVKQLSGNGQPMASQGSPIRQTTVTFMGHLVFNDTTRKVIDGKRAASS
jgi:hypothetical protein